MAETMPSGMTVEEFLAWAEGRPGRYELDGGVVFKMASQRLGHLLAKAGAFNALATAIGKAGVPCRALPDGATVRIDARTAYEPDALVYCGPRLPRSAIEVPEPVVVVEVLSPGTGRYDRQDKFARYFTVPSIQHYLLVDADRRVVIHHARDGDGIATRLIGAGALRLDPPGLEVAVEDLFGGPPDA